MSSSQSPPPTSPTPNEADKRELEKFMACADPGEIFTYGRLALFVEEGIIIV